MHSTAKSSAEHFSAVLYTAQNGHYHYASYIYAMFTHSLVHSFCTAVKWLLNPRNVTKTVWCQVLSCSVVGSALTFTCVSTASDNCWGEKAWVRG